MRKRLLEYDDVMNSQREVIYRRRRNALYGDRIKVDLDNMLFDLCQAIMERYFDIPDAEGMRLECIRQLSVDPKITEKDLNDLDETEITQIIYDAAKAYYKRKSENLASTLAKGIGNIRKQNPQIERIIIPFSDGSKQLRIIVNAEEALKTEGQAVIDELEKVSTLAIIDDKWKNHLREMDDLRRSVQNAVFEQKDPLLVYKFESFQLFQQALNDINQQVLSLLFKADLHVEERNQNQKVETKRDDFSRMNAKHGAADEEKKKNMQRERALMNNNAPERKLSRRERRAQDGNKKKKGGSGRIYR